MVGKYRDGRTVRGYTNDFSPMKPYLHVSPTPLADEAKFVSMIHLDALFFFADASHGESEWEALESSASYPRAEKSR